jgi:hypothetical protein
MKTTKFNFKKLSFNRFYESVRDTVKLFSLLMPLRQMAPRDLEASLFRHLKKQKFVTHHQRVCAPLPLDIFDI